MSNLLSSTAQNSDPEDAHTWTWSSASDGRAETPPSVAKKIAKSILSAVEESVLDFSGMSSGTREACAYYAGMSEFDCEQQWSLKLFKRLSRMQSEDFEPGERVEAFSFLSDCRKKAGEQNFYSGLESALSASFPKLGDDAKASALRAIGLLSSTNERSAIKLLLKYLDSDSPAQASAAAISLGDVADRFSVPAIKAAKKTVRWKSALKEIDRTIADISK